MLPANRPTLRDRRVSDKLKFRLYEWAEWLAKVALIAICGLLWRQNESLALMTQSISTHEQQITELRSEIKSVRSESMSRAETLEMMKRVEQQLQIIILQSQLEKSRKDKP